MRLANSRQGVADEHIYDSTATVKGCHENRAGGLFTNFADDLRFTSAGRETQGVDGGVGIIGRDDGEELAFIGDVQGIEAEQLAGATDSIAHRDLIFKKDHAETAVARQFVERGRGAATSWIAHPADARTSGANESFDERKHGASVRAKIGFEIEFAAREQDGNAVIADRAREKNPIADADRTRINRDAGKEAADAGGGYVHAVGFAMLDDFGVTGSDANTGILRGFGHGSNFGFENRGGQSGFENVRDDEGFSASAGDGEVVDGAVDGEFADRTAGEGDGLYDKTVGSDGNFRAVDFDMSSIAERAGRVPEKERSEKTFDQFAAGFAAGSVSHLDLRVTEAYARRIGQQRGGSGRVAQATELRLTITALRCS